MKHYDIFKRIIATKEKSNGNDTVGDMWTETKSFDGMTPISEIVDWAKDCSGKLTITIDEATVTDRNF